MGVRHILGLLVILVTTGSISCTRSVNAKAGITIQLPSGVLSKANGALTVGDKYVAYVAINVTGAGMDSAKVLTWDSNDGQTPMPASFDITVPSGYQRLVQVLVLYKVAGQGGQQFSYGDGVTDIVADTKLNVTVNAVGTAVSESQIIGRWLDNSSNVQGPTTKIIMKYTPPNKPAMIVHTSEMFGGLFSLFAVQGGAGGFDYVTSEGESMFNGSVSIDSFSTFNSRVMKVLVPAHYRRRYDGNTESFEQQPPSYVVAGWFGTNQNLAIHAVCYPSGTAAIRDAYQSPSTSSPLEWNSGMVVAGGTGSALGANDLCISTGLLYEDYIGLDAYGLAHHDGALGVRGPYLDKLSGGYRQAVTATHSASDVTVNYEYARNVITSARAGVDGTDIFYRTNTTSSASDDDFKESGSDGADCSGISTGKYGFNLLANKPAAAGYPAESVTVNTTAVFKTAFNEGRVQIVLCPYQNGKTYFNSAVTFRSYNIGVASGPMPAAEKFAISSYASPLAFTWPNNICTPMLLKGLTNAGLPAQLPAASQIAITGTSAGTMTIHSGNACQSYDYWTTGSAAMRDNGYIVYLYNVAATTHTATLTISAPGMQTLIPGLSFANEHLTPRTELLKVIAPTAMKAHTCYPLELVSLSQKSGDTQVMPFMTAYSFAWPTLTDLEYYYDPACLIAWASPSSSFTVSNTLQTTPIYVKYKGALSTLSLQPTSAAFVAASGTYTGGNSISVNQPTGPVKVSIYAPTTMTAGQCYMVTANLQDYQNNSSIYAAEVTGALGVSGIPGNFNTYSGSCSSCYSISATASVSIPSGQTTYATCFKPDVTGTAQFTLTNSASLPVNASAISVGFPNPSGLVFKATGQTFTSGTAGVSGTESLTAGTLANFTIYAVYTDSASMKHVVTNFNGPISTAGSVNLSGFPATVTFANGVATLTATPAASGSTSFSIYQSTPYLSGSFSGNAGP